MNQTFFQDLCEVATNVQKKSAQTPTLQNLNIQNPARQRWRSVWSMSWITVSCFTTDTSIIIKDSHKNVLKIYNQIL